MSVSRRSLIDEVDSHALECDNGPPVAVKPAEASAGAPSVRPPPHAARSPAPLPDARRPPSPQLALQLVMATRSPPRQASAAPPRDQSPDDDLASPPPLLGASATAMALLNRKEPAPAASSGAAVGALSASLLNLGLGGRRSWGGSQARMREQRVAVAATASRAW